MMNAATPALHFDLKNNNEAEIFAEDRLYRRSLSYDSLKSLFVVRYAVRICRCKMF